MTMIKRNTPKKKEYLHWTTKSMMYFFMEKVVDMNCDFGKLFFSPVEVVRRLCLKQIGDNEEDAKWVVDHEKILTITNEDIDKETIIYLNEQIEKKKEMIQEIGLKGNISLEDLEEEEIS